MYIYGLIGVRIYHIFKLNPNFRKILTLFDALKVTYFGHINMPRMLDLS